MGSLTFEALQKRYVLGRGAAHLGRRVRKFPHPSHETTGAHGPRIERDSHGFPRRAVEEETMRCGPRREWREAREGGGRGRLPR